MAPQPAGTPPARTGRALLTICAAAFAHMRLTFIFGFSCSLLKSPNPTRNGERTTVK